MLVWNVLHAALWKCRTQKIAKNSPSAHHRTTLSGYIWATKAHIDNRKKLLSSNISSICSDNILNFGLLTAENCWRVWAPQEISNFNGFRVLASILQQRRSPDANQTLHDVWPSHALVYTFLGGSWPLTEFCQLQYSLYVQILCSPILAALGLLHGSRALGVSQTLWRWAEGH